MKMKEKMKVVPVVSQILLCLYFLVSPPCVVTRNEIIKAIKTAWHLPRTGMEKYIKGNKLLPKKKSAAL